jgi:hypothetical protein
VATPVFYCELGDWTRAADCSGFVYDLGEKDGIKLEWAAWFYSPPYPFNFRLEHRNLVKIEDKWPAKLQAGVVSRGDLQL